MGGEYSRRAALRNKHVIVCSTSLTQETVMDFLNEFYAHPKLEVSPHCGQLMMQPLFVLRRFVCLGSFFVSILCCLLGIQDSR